MEQTITFFDEKVMENICNLVNSFVERPDNFEKYELDLRKQGNKLIQSILASTIEFINEQIKETPYRKQNWKIERHDSKNLLTKSGNVIFDKTLYKNKATGEYSYLLDKVLGFSPHQRMTENVETDILKEATQTSYRRGGIAASECASISKQAVKNKIHSLNFSVQKGNQHNQTHHSKRAVQTIYIEADEDHAHLQFSKKKGDLKKSIFGRKQNGIITKLVYVHEGFTDDSKNKKRHMLNTKRYFCSQPKFESNENFWDRIYEFINNTYDLKKVENIIIQGDCASWIQAGLDAIPNSIFIIDGFHLKQSINRIAAKAFDSENDVKFALWEYIRKDDLQRFYELGKKISNVQDKENAKRSVENEVQMLVQHWSAVRMRVLLKGVICGCSTEGHIHHYLSDRLSSRPLGWCYKGAENVAKLIEMKLNGENIAQMVKQQKHAGDKELTKEQEVIKRQYLKNSYKLKALNSSEVIGKYSNWTRHISWPGKIHRDWIDHELIAM